jgi:MYXO-CTERM domain-containing protein
MSAARSVSATFNIITYALTAAPHGNGTGSITSAPAGLNCAPGQSCSHSFNAGTVVTLTATPTAGSFLAAWGGACSGSAMTCTVAMNMERSVEATFTRYATLTVSLAGNGTGSVAANGIACGMDCSEDYVPGATVTLTATASGGSTFNGWTGACAGQSSVCTLTLATSQSATASFGAPPAGGGSGNNNSSGGGGGGGLDSILLALAGLLLLLRSRRRAPEKPTLGVTRHH